MRTRDRLKADNPLAATVDGFDAALVGVVYRFGSQPVALYDRTKCIEILMEQGMSYDAAVDNFETNVADAWVGVATPAYCILDGD